MFRFSSLAAEHKCIFFSFVAMPLSFWDITWYSPQWASVCLFLIHRPPWHRNIFNCIFYSPIHQAKLRTLQEGKWVSQSRLAMNRGNKAHWSIESKVQNELGFIRVPWCVWNLSPADPQGSGSQAVPPGGRGSSVSLGKCGHGVYLTYKHFVIEFSCRTGTESRSSDP